MIGRPGAAFPSPEANPRSASGFDPRQTQGYEEPPPRLEAGMQLGDVTIKGMLARGGVCEVYRGEIPLLGQEVAVKVLNFRFKERDDVIRRFQREAMALRELQNHEGVVRVISAGERSWVGPYIVMELLQGDTLRALLSAQGAQPITRAVSIGILIARYMQGFHAVDIIHRDLKPENIMIQEDGPRLRVVILDLGCVRTPGGVSTTDQALTMGTARYMSPEHCQHTHITPATDQYALGHMLYEMILGEHAFERLRTKDTTQRDEIFMQLGGDIRTLPAPLCPPELAGIIDRMLEKDATLRFPSMMDAAKALTRFLEAFVATNSDDIDREAALAMVRAEGPRVVLPAAPDGVTAPRRARTRPKNGNVLFSARLSAPSVVIEIDTGGSLDRERYILEDTAVLGRGAREDGIHINLRDVSVSRKHAELRVLREAGPDTLFQLLDLGSKGGIEVDGKVGRSAVVRYFDSVRLGEVRIMIFPPGRFVRDEFEPHIPALRAKTPDLAATASGDVERPSAEGAEIPRWAWILAGLFIAGTILALVAHRLGIGP